MAVTDYREMTDSELCLHASKGAMEATEMLYKRHYELLLNFGMKYYADRDFVKDCIQDLFVKLICNPGGFAGVTYVRAWLLVSLKNVIYDKLKSIKTHSQLEEVPFMNLPDEVFLSGIAEGYSDEELKRLRELMRAFRRLSGNQRMAIYLHYVRGMSHKEISVFMNMKAQSSMNLLSRAVVKLRRLIRHGLPGMFF